MTIVIIQIWPIRSGGEEIKDADKRKIGVLCMHQGLMLFLIY